MHQVRPQGLYLVRKLIEKHGHKGNMSAWLSDLKGDCPKRERRGPPKPLRPGLPDLPKVL
jgi:hypothetical protein